MFELIWSNFRLRTPFVVVAALITLQLLGLPLSAGPPDFTVLGRRYDDELQPLLKQYCIKCHGAERVEGEVDFTLIENGTGAVQQGILWQHHKRDGVQRANAARQCAAAYGGGT